MSHSDQFWGVWSWNEWGRAVANGGIHEDIKQMQIMNHLHDINSKKISAWHQLE